jgi:tetratricopeptide (TPR) repeat protein
MNMNAFRKVAGLLLLALLVAAGVPAQSGQQQPPPTPPPTPAPAPSEPAAPPVNPEEEADAKAFFDTARVDVPKQAELGEAFLVKYPESRYREAIYSRLVSAYLALGDIDKLYVAGEKALAMNPDNVDVLSVVAYAVPRRVNPSELDAPAKLQKVEQYGKHAIEILVAMTKPESLTEEDFTKAKNEKLSMAHSGLALVSYHKQDFAGMAAELEQATTLATSPDPSDFWLLGISYQQVKRFGDAATAFGKCAEVQWAYQDRCKQSKEQSEKQAALQPKN